MWLSKIKPSISARARPSSSPGDVLGTSNKPNSGVKLANNVTVGPTPAIILFRHMRIHQQRGFSVTLGQTKQILLLFTLVCGKANVIAGAQAPVLIVAL